MEEISEEETIVDVVMKQLNGKIVGI